MVGEYTFNETIKRLELHDAKCVYCNSEMLTKLEEHYFVSVYNVLDRTNLVAFEYIKYNEIAIGIPRCTNCYVIHDSAGDRAGMISWGIAFLSILGCIIIGGLTGIIVCFALLFSIIFIYPSIRSIIIKRKGIHTINESIKTHKLVQNFLKNGWSLNEPSAR